jgi:hypothetical protein
VTRRIATVSSLDGDDQDAPIRGCTIPFDEASSGKRASESTKGGCMNALNACPVGHVVDHQAVLALSIFLREGHARRFLLADRMSLPARETAAVIATWAMVNVSAGDVCSAGLDAACVSQRRFVCAISAVSA